MALVTLLPNHNNKNGLLDLYSKTLIGQFVWGQSSSSIWCSYTVLPLIIPAGIINFLPFFLRELLEGGNY